MKKMLSVLIIAMLPSYAFALIGFGLQFGSDLSKLDPQSFTEGSGELAFNVNSYEMKSNPVGGGGYAFVDLFGFALEGEFDVAFGEYEFSFGNQYMDFDPIPFGWARASYAATLKKNIMDLSIPFLAKAAINVGGGFGGHVSTARFGGAHELGRPDSRTDPPGQRDCSSYEVDNGKTDEGLGIREQQTIRTGCTVRAGGGSI